MRIIFFGTPDFAVPALEKLVELKEDIAAIVTQPDQPKGRGLEVTFSAVKETAIKHGLTILQPPKIDKLFLARLKDIKPDLIIVASYGKILPPAILELPQFGCLNVHASLLPKYRGASPIAAAILNGESEAGVTIMQMNEKMDQGDIVFQEAIPIDNEETAATLSEKLSLLGSSLLEKTIKELKETGTLPHVPQDSSLATYAHRLKKENGKIDWAKPAIQIERQVRAMNPWPGAYTYYQKLLLKIWKTKVEDKKEAGAPGTIISNTEFTVTTSDNLLTILELQPAGKKKMTAEEFLRGHIITVGEVLK